MICDGELMMARRKKPFPCGQCGNDEHFIWKTRNGKPTKVLTTFAWMTPGQMQIQCSSCGHKFSIARKLLELDPYQRIAPEVRRKLGLLGALTTFRVAETFMATSGAAVDKMTIWKAVQKTGEEIAFSLDPKGEARGEADGTGIDIGSYNGNWNRLFMRSLKALQEFTSFFLVTDGDTSILDGLAGKVKTLYQRCLWHIPHQLKFALWQDRAKVMRKSPEWLSVMARIYKICSLRSGLDEDDEIQALIALKTKTLDALVEGCREKEYPHTVAYLKHTWNDLYYWNFQQAERENHQPGGTSLPDRQYANQCQQVDNRWSPQRDQGQAGILLQWFRGITEPNPTRAAQVST